MGIGEEAEGEMSAPEELLAFQCKAAKIKVEREFKFHPERRWRADFLVTGHKLLIEVEGGLWVAGRHSRGAGMQKDMEKYNAAALLGYRILRFSPDMVKSGEALKYIEEIIK